MSEDILSLSFSSKSTSSNSSLISLPFFELQEKNRIEIYSVLGIGDPIVDIISEIDSKTINDHGMKLGDSIFASEDCDQKNVEVFDVLESMSSVSYTPGGSVQNTLRVLSGCLNNDASNRKYFKVSMLGSLGDDLYKNKIWHSLEEIGVNPMLEILEGDKTSRCGVGIYKKEKLFVTQLRASKRLTEKFIENNKDKILEHQALLIEGYLLQNKFDMVKKLCEAFCENNKKIILTLSAKFIVKCHYDKIIELGNKADIIAGSMEEALELAGNKGENTKDVFEIIFRKLEPKENRLLVITDGANGAFCARYDYKNNQIISFLQCFAPKLKDEEIKDLNGAGDAFLGGFLSEYMKGNDIYDCCKKGINAATIILKNVGCTFPKKTNFMKI